ncbi:MAG: M48 family metalloprotease [Granulosicoccus sp.]
MKWHSILLPGGIVLAMVITGLLIHCLVVGFTLVLFQQGSMLNPSAPALLLIALIWLATIAGCIFRALDVRAGGAVLARRFGAVRASNRTRHEKENRLLNVVAEIAIASGTAQPDVFVLRDDVAVNAFVLGNNDGRTVIVVTQGALDAFNREELQGIVAHEFGHIVNGDLPSNMRLMIVLAGLMGIDELGHWLTRKSPGSAFHPARIAGAFIKALGFPGVHAGKLIRSTCATEREFVADSSAAGLTRNPYGLASALTVVKARQQEPPLHSRHAKELAHLCFHSGNTFYWYQKLLPGHPGLQRRIDKLDPHHEMKRKARMASPDKPLAESEVPVISELVLRPFDRRSRYAADGITRRAGNDAIHSIPDDLTRSLSDVSTCTAALFALFVSNRQEEQNDYLNSLAFSFDTGFAQDVKSVLSMMPDEFQSAHIAIIYRACDFLKSTMAQEDRHRLLLKLERIISARDDYNLIAYATAQLIRRRLHVEFPILRSVTNERRSLADARKVKTFESMGGEFALLLSLVIEASGAVSEKLDEQFERLLKCYTQGSYPRRTARESGIIEEVEAAFQTLYVQPKSIRQAFVQHCIQIMRKDGSIAPDEQKMINLFAASLCCEELLAA